MSAGAVTSRSGVLIRRIDSTLWIRESGGLTNRWSGRVKDKVPGPNAGVRAAQLNR